MNIDVANLIMAVMVYKQSTYFVEAAKRNSPCYPEGTLAPNDADCSSYLHCSYERFLLMPCPGGLNFDPKTLTCNFPDRVSNTYSIFENTLYIPKVTSILKLCTDVKNGYLEQI